MNVSDNEGVIGYRSMIIVRQHITVFVARRWDMTKFLFVGCLGHLNEPLQYSTCKLINPTL